MFRGGSASVVLLMAAAACVEVDAVDPPEVPPGAESVLFVRTCGSKVEVEAFDLPGDPSLHTESCAAGLTYWYGYLPESLAELHITRGRQPPRGCDGSELACCREQALPTPPTGWLFRANVSEGERRFLPTEAGAGNGWPSEIASFALTRACDCPSQPPQVETLSLANDRKVRIANFRGDELLILTVGHQIAPQPTVSRLFHTTLAALLEDGFPRESFASISDRLPSEMVALEDGRYFLGLEGSNGAILAGRVGEAPVLIPHPRAHARRESRLVALRPGSDADPQIATLGRSDPSEFEIFRQQDWTAYGDRTLMRGTCSDRFNREQREGILWVDERELLVMPLAISRQVRLTQTATNAPDGLWQWRDGALSWLRVDKPEDDCLHGMVMTESFGLLVYTHAPRILQRTGTGWREIVSADAFPPYGFESGLRTLFDLDGGLLYSRGDGVLGLQRDGTRCFEDNFTNCRIEQMVRVGDVILAGCESFGEQRPGGLVIIRP